MSVIHVFIHRYNDIVVPFLLNNTNGILEESKENSNRILSICDALNEMDDIRVEYLEYIENINHIISTIHDEEYIKFLKSKSIELNDEEYLIEHSFHPYYVENDTPILKNSYKQSYEAASTAYRAAKSILDGEEYAYAVCRPPGHHAGKKFMGGYCYINNAAIAATTLLSQKFNKIGILDIDYHFGNGTEDIVSLNQNITFVSIHASTEFNYPYVKTKEKNENSLFLSIDKEPSQLEYLQYINTALSKLSICEAIVVSLGYDIVKNDPHGKWKLLPEIYEEIGKKFGSMNIPMCFVQEGGYDEKNNKNCSKNLFKGILSSKGGLQ